MCIVAPYAWVARRMTVELSAPADQAAVTSRVGRPAKAHLLARSRSAPDAARVRTRGQRLRQGRLAPEASIPGPVLCKPLQRGSDRIVLLLSQVAALGAADDGKLDLYPKWAGTPTQTSRSSAGMHRCREKAVLVDAWIAGHLFAGSLHPVPPGPIADWTQ